jgi:UDP-glucuronate decarboxylase
MQPYDGRVVSNFIVQALDGLPLTVSGDGTQTRSFCYVADLIDGLIALMDSPATATGPINLGNPREFTINELAALVLKKTGSRSSIKTQPLPQDDPKQRRPDISRARHILNWHPRVPLEEGLDKTVRYFASQEAPSMDAARVAAE